MFPFWLLLTRAKMALNLNLSNPFAPCPNIKHHVVVLSETPMEMIVSIFCVAQVFTKLAYVYLSIHLYLSILPIDFIYGSYLSIFSIDIIY